MLSHILSKQNISKSQFLMLVFPYPVFVATMHNGYLVYSQKGMKNKFLAKAGLEPWTAEFPL